MNSSLDSNVTCINHITVNICWMIRRHLTEVVRIEQLSFEHGWDEEDFLRIMKQTNCIGMVAEYNNKVVGYVFYKNYNNKIHIYNFAVHPAYRRLKVGSQIINRIISKLNPNSVSHPRSHITLEIRETNLQAQLFFKRMEFRATRTIREFYKDSAEDAYFMQYWCCPDFH